MSTDKEEPHLREGRAEARLTLRSDEVIAQVGTVEGAGAAVVLHPVFLDIAEAVAERYMQNLGSMVETEQDLLELVAGGCTGDLRREWERDSLTETIMGVARVGIEARKEAVAVKTARVLVMADSLGIRADEDKARDVTGMVYKKVYGIDASARREETLEPLARRALDLVRMEATRLAA